MRTSVELDKVRALVEGRHENPFEILGPHEVSDAGRPAVAVRAYLPDSQQAWVVQPAHSGVAADAADPSGRACSRRFARAADANLNSPSTCSAWPTSAANNRRCTIPTPSRRC